MDETEHMPRYTLTLVDSTGAMEPLILMDDDLKSIAAKLEGRVSAKTRGRLPRGTGGISATPKGYRAYSTVTDPLTGKDHRVSGFGRTRSQAEARLKEKLAEFDRTHRVGYVRPPTVAEWMDHWLTDVCKPRLKPRTWGTYASVIANNIVPSIGAVRLDELKPAHFRRMERYVMEEQGKSSGTAGSAWRTLHKALEDAVLEGVIERNPAVKGTAPRVALKERAALTPDQAADLIAAETDDAWRLMWMLAFMTGMRQGERLGLTEDELRRDGGRLIILVEWQAQHLTKREVEGLPKGVECTPLGNGMYRTRPKTEKGRRAIPLPEALADQLLAYIERHGVNGDGLVFHDDEGLPLTGSVERRRWYRALDRHHGPQQGQHDERDLHARRARPARRRHRRRGEGHRGLGAKRPAAYSARPWAMGAEWHGDFHDLPSRADQPGMTPDAGLRRAAAPCLRAGRR